MIMGPSYFSDKTKKTSVGLVYIQSHNQKFGTIPYDTPDDAGGRGRHFKSSEPESQPLTP